MDFLEAPPIANNRVGHGGDDNINENDDHVEKDDYL